MSRRSARIRDQQEHSRADEQLKEIEEENPSHSGTRVPRSTVESRILQGKSARKRQRTKNDGELWEPVKKARGKRRSLSRLPDMPLDILYEIFGHIAPLDLLHLTQTTKAVRNVLMRRSAASIWKKVLAGVEGLPECPDDLNEAQYVRLVFDNHCFSCGATVKITYWSSRVRCCKRCFPAQFMEYAKLLDVDRDIKWFELIPHEYRAQNAGSWFLKERVNVLYTQIQLLLDDEEKLLAFYDTQRTVLKKLDESQRALSYWQELQDDKRSQELEDIRARRRAMIIEKLQPLGLGDELDLMPSTLYYLALEQKWFKDPTELTERRWNNIKDAVISYMRQAQLLRFAANRAFKVYPFVKLVSAIYDTFLQAVEVSQPHLPLPGIADLCKLPEVLALTEKFNHTDGVLVMNLGQEMEKERIQLLAQLPSMCDAWRAACKRTLLSIMPSQENKHTQEASVSIDEASGSSSDDNSVTEAFLDARLALATTWFTCVCPEYTTSTISYPRVLALPDIMESTRLDLHSTATTATLRNAICLEYEFGPWNEGDYRVGWDAKSAAIARSLVEACGKDLETTTASQMDELDPRFACAVCAQPTGLPSFLVHLDDDDDTEEKDMLAMLSGRSQENKGKGITKGKGKEKQLPQPNQKQRILVPTFSWRRAISHSVDVTHDAQRWVLLNSKDRERVLELSRSLGDYFTGYQCRRCRSCLSDPEDDVMGLTRIKDHLAFEHDIPYVQAEEGTDYYKALHIIHSEEDVPGLVYLREPDTWIPMD